MKVLILYFTKTGHTLEAANATAKGIREAGSQADLINVTQFDTILLEDYEAFVVASPCWAGSIGAAVLPGPMERALASLTTNDLRGKRCGTIAVHSGLGGENTIKRIGEILAEKGCQDFSPGPVARAGVPFSIFKGPSVQPEDEARFEAYGKAFVK